MSALDVVVLTPDLDWAVSMKALLARPKALGIRPVRYHVLRDSMHDASVVRRAGETLRPYLREARYALVTVDAEGAGLGRLPSEAIAKQVKG